MISLPNRYQPDGTASSGGFGSVVFCDDVHLSRKVAIKFIADAAEARRIIDELRALLLLRSKHVVQVYDIVPQDDGTIGIVEEFVDGDDLWDHRLPRTSLEAYLKTLWQISSGIADIHAAGVIHRDIKPNNMKLDGEGIVKIFDFGLARDEGPKAVTKGFLGTVGFAAPELYGESTVPFSRSIDTYAFGVTARFFLDKKLPREMVETPPRAAPAGVFSGHEITVPAGLAVLFEKCLAADPADRPAMSQVRDEIARHLLRDKHQALAVFNGKPLYLNAANRSIRLELTAIGRVEISYDGLRFSVSSASGEVYINNNAVHAGSNLPGSCVVAIGGGHKRPGERAFITFDVSNPEVVL